MPRGNLLEPGGCKNFTEGRAAWGDEWGEALALNTSGTWTPAFSYSIDYEAIRILEAGGVGILTPTDST